MVQHRQLVADVLNSQHAETGAIWRINAKLLSTCRRRRHYVATRSLLLLLLALCTALQSRNVVHDVIHFVHRFMFGVI